MREDAAQTQEGPSLPFLSLFSFVSLGVLGALVPFLGAQLAGRGLRPEQIGWLMAMIPLGRILGAPLWGQLADRYRAAGLLVRVGTLLSLLGALLLWQANSGATAAVAVFLFWVARVPLGPLVDAVILDTLRRNGRDVRDYGRVRLWGSLGFMSLAVLLGWGGQPLEVGVGLSLLLLLLSLGLPSRGEGGPAPIFPALRVLLRQPGLLPFLGWACLQAATVSTYDTFFSVHVRALGLDSWVVSAAVAVGVGVEVGVMLLGRRILGWLGVGPAMGIAALSGLPRWWVVAVSADPRLLVGIQVLHGAGFALFWLAGVQWMAERAPREVAASAQSLLAASSYGVGALGGALLAGTLAQHYGSPAIFYGLFGLSAGASVLALAAARR